ncbi:MULTISPECIES: hypothetical protein [Pseudomonas]|uniref:Uncharacterized protein n=1 Tax=Pseudomonas mosselii TaxID=78327 RepID=A0A7W2PYQ1_9PSED|nr:MULTISPECIES: hypothetical protein [Pseudomonas]MBA6065690.1 hypothetical protein [Pseudomonas mosselii]
MAVYTVENGQLKRVAEALDEYSGQEWESSWSCDDYFGAMGFSLWDDARDVYAQYQRAPAVVGAPLPGISYLFHVHAHGDVMDCILVRDSLPDYLAVVAMLEPLRTRDAELRKEVEEYPLGRPRR